MQGLSWEVAGGLIGAVLVFTSSTGFEPLKDWCRTRVHPFWGWTVAAVGDPLWIGFWFGFAWAIYSGNNLFHAAIFGGLIGGASHASEDVFAILGTFSRSIVRRYAMPSSAPQVPNPQRAPNAYLPDLSEEEAHKIMDDHEEDDPKAALQAPN